MTNEEKLSKMCSIVKEIDQEEEAKAAAVLAGPMPGPAPTCAFCGMEIERRKL